MIFSSLLFLFRFLPAVLVLYYLAPRPLRNLVLLLCSLVFYAWGEPVYIILMIVSITWCRIRAVFWLTDLKRRENGEQPERRCLVRQ